MRSLIIIISFVFTFIGILGAQIPDPPLIQVVRIEPFTGLKTVDWLPGGSAGVNAYIIHKKKGNINIAIDTVYGIDKTSYSWNENDNFITTGPLTVTVSAWDTTNDEESKLPGHHSTVYLEARLDECSYNLRLEWSNYTGWGDSLDYYVVFRNNVPLDTLNNQARLYSDPGISAKQFYHYYILAHHKAGRISTSNGDTLSATFKTPPEYIYALGNEISGQRSIELFFDIGSGSELESYYLLRATRADGTYDTVQSFTYQGEGQISLIDELPEEKPYYYKLASINLCGKPARMSNLSSAIFLSSENKNMTNRLRWNKYLEWDGGVYKYKIYRSIDDGAPLFLDELAPADTFYVDDISDAAMQGNKGKYCYYIEAYGNNTLPEKAISGTSCVYAGPMIYMPNAFTPDDDGINEEFWPVLNFLPSEYIFVIRNRWGNTLFQTNDPNGRWDGSYAGDKVPGGVYIYFVRAVSQDGKAIEKEGRLNVLYH